MSTRQQSETDESLQTQLAALPTSTPTEQAYAALATQLMESAAFWRAKADTERKHNENTTLAAQQAITKLMSLVSAEGESALSNLRSSHPSVSSPPSALTASPHASMLHGHASTGVHSAHPSHLSRRVSFNRDVLMVVSPEIGALHDGSNGGSSSAGPSVARVDEESDDGAKTGAGAGSASTTTAFQRERRLSRTEFNEGAILKQHLPIDELAKEEVAVQAAQ